MTRIFISFRNGDGDWAAKLIRESLTRRFGENSVFLSSDSIPLAAPFPAVLTESAGTCDVMLALVGPRWLDGRGPDRRSPLFADGDWVRREIATALAAGRPVAAVRLDGASRLIADDLPTDVRELAERQDITLSRRSYDTDIARLEEELMKITPGLVTKPGSGSRITVKNDVKIGEANGLKIYGAQVPRGRDLDVVNKVRIDKAKRFVFHGLREPEPSAKNNGSGVTRRSAWWRHGVPAAVSVLLGTLVAILINLATAGTAGVSTLSGLGTAVAAWATWEAWLAVRIARTG